MRSLPVVLFALTACGTDLRSDDTRDPVNTAPDAGTNTGGPGPSTPTPDGGVSGVPGDGGPLTDCEEATFHSDLAWIEQKVFAPSCLGDCHTDPTPSASLNLSAGLSHHSLVNVTSTQFPSWKRVVPGNPGASMLLVQLGGEPGPELEGTMPWGEPKLCDEKIDAVRRWIAAGAPQ